MSKTPTRTPSVSDRRREAERRRQEVRRRLFIALGVALALIALAVIAFVLNQDEEPAATTEVTGERPLATIEPQVRDAYYAAVPEMTIDTAKTYEAVIRMADGGEMRLTLFDDDAPIAVNNFVYLANQGFYDGTTFHRVLADFMAQGGDPTGTGSGGPGYSFEDETENGLTFDRRGLLAMANAGPDTNGSQFFITFAPTPHLDGLHTIFGELTEGDDVLSGLTLRDPGTATEPGDVIEEIVIFES